MLLESLQNGRYRLLRPLGTGGMGEVYLMEDTRINRQVAIKVVRSEATPYPDSSATRDAARLFQREARAVAALEHPNILPLYDFGEENLHGTTLTYMVMPFCQEGSFANWLRQHTGSHLLAPQDVTYFVGQAADALQYAHDHQTLHLDVKPSNFLIRTNPKDPQLPYLLLADFGIAKLSAATSSSSRTVRGTPTSMAPEQWSGNPVPATDQYALAGMAYELLVVRPPFLGGLEQLMYQHFRVPPPPPSKFNSHLSGAIDAVFLRALAKKPEDRFPSVAAFASALGQAVDAMPTELASRPQRHSDNDIRATLAISQTEAQTSTSRTITLPGGRKVTVNIPAGAYDGQVIRLQNLGEPSSGSGPAGALILTLAIQQPEASDPLANVLSAEPTVRTFNPNLQAPLIPPPPPGFSPLPPPNQDIPALLPKSRKSTSSRLALSKGKTILLIALALLVIASGIGLYYAIYTNQVATSKANPTATARASDATATAHSNATFTAFNATGTAFAQANATATATVLAPLAAANPNPYSPGGGTLLLYDPLHNNGKGYSWDEGADSYGGNCAFTGGVYHASQSNTSYLHYCMANSTDFSDFAFEVQMQIIKGDSGGIIFRANTSSSQYYLFVIGQNGSYGLYLYVDSNGSDAKTLLSSNSSAIKQGLNQVNLLALVAKGNSITLYVNHQQINSVNESTYSHGEIGFVVDPNNQPTDAAFSNAKVWTL